MTSPRDQSNTGPGGARGGRLRTFQGTFSDVLRHDSGQRSTCSGGRGGDRRLDRSWGWERAAVPGESDQQAELLETRIVELQAISSAAPEVVGEVRFGGFRSALAWSDSPWPPVTPRPTAVHDSESVQDHTSNRNS